MAPRAIWSGVVSFGMVSIPVKLFSATRSEDISFKLIHSTCGTPIQQKRWCPTDEEEVPWDEVVRGYQYAKGKFVTLTDEDFEQLPLASKHTIEIVAFVEASEIDPVYYEKSYYLAPDSKGEKPYALLFKALEEKGLSAIASITMRKREQLCAIRPHGGAIVLETLFYADEVELERQVDQAAPKIREKELEMAYVLIDLLRKSFDPTEYRDHYREALAELIDAKLEGKKIVTAPPVRDTKVIDLADALARSVAAARKGTKAVRPGARRAASHAAAPRRARKSTTRASARKVG
ncbi:MAG: Ku protein [Gemmatimonadota bacterium]